jgi:hypothetical protein
VFCCKIWMEYNFVSLFNPIGLFDPVLCKNSKFTITSANQTPRTEPSSELYRPSDRR